MLQKMIVSLTGGLAGQDGPIMRWGFTADGDFTVEVKRPAAYNFVGSALTPKRVSDWLSANPIPDPPGFIEPPTIAADVDDRGPDGPRANGENRS